MPAIILGNATKPSRFGHFWPAAQSLAPDIWTSKHGPYMVCFVHFDLEMCFAPQRRALFQHLNFQKWSDNGVLCTFSLWNGLRATTACTFSTSQLPKVVRSWCVLYILTWKCASRHNGVQFFISPLGSCLRTRRFSEPTFRPSGATNHWKNAVFRNFPTFSRICIFFLLTLSLLLFFLLIFLFSLPLPFSAFHLSILSEVWLLNFLRQGLHKVFPSTTLYYKACAKHVPVLLCSTNLAQSTTLHYKACTKHFPVLLCTTKLAHSSSQYYFVVPTLHKALPSIY